MSKFLLNLLVQISKALVYSKIKFYSQKNFPVTFGPSGLSAHFFFFSTGRFLHPPPHWASASRPAQPTFTAQPATFFFLPHQSQARTALPAGLAPPPRLTLTPPPEEKMAASIPLHSPINQRHFRLFNHW
jgi:hypothetical protein